MRKLFKDSVKLFNDGSKTVISVRDGFQEYLGIEIGHQPPEKTFKIYRSPDTIREVARKLKMIPVTNGHVELETIPEDKIVGYVDGTKIVKYIGNDFDSTIALKNELQVRDNLLQLVDGKRELSLGYSADTIEHDTYDFEQIDIVPHHIAIVEAGRCGTICKFSDERKDMKKKFVDSENQIPADKVTDETSMNEEESNTETTENETKEVADEETTSTINLAKVSEIVRDLPEAIKLMSIDDLTNLIPVLEKAISGAKANMPQEEAVEETMEEENVATSDEDVIEEEKTMDECSKKNYSDSKEFKDAVVKFADERVGIILKAKTFLDEDYDFAKDCKSIMRDSIATQTDEQFKDEELSVAFKMLSKKTNYQNFADSKSSEFDKLKDKEI